MMMNIRPLYGIDHTHPQTTGSRTRRQGFIMLGVLVMFAVLAAMVVVITKMEALSNRRFQYWRDSNQLESLAVSASEVAKARLLAKGEAAKGSLDGGGDAVEVTWSIEPAGNETFLIRGYAKTPSKGPVRLQGEVTGRFSRKVEKDEVRLVPVKS